MRIVCILTLFFYSLTGLGQDLDSILKKYNDGSIPYIAIAELQQHGDYWILDTREKEEYEVSHLPNALFVGYHSFSEKSIKNLVPNLDTPIVVYCSIGVRSEAIGKKLRGMGYKDIKNLYGGIFEWVNQGFSIEDMDGKPTKRIHAFSKQWGRYLLKGKKIY